MATAPPRTTAGAVLAEIRALANEFARDAHERRSRRELSRVDFDRLGLGYLRPTWGVAYDRLLEGSWALPD